MASKKKAAPSTAPSSDTVALLMRIYDEGGVYLTESEGSAIVAAGYAKVDFSNTDGDKALVMLTPVGSNIVVAHKSKSEIAVHDAAANNSGDIAENVNKENTMSASIRSDIPMPTKTKRAGRSGSKYDFDKLEVGQSFHVANAAGKTSAETLAAIASSMSGAKRKYAEPVLDDKGNAVSETVKVKTFEVDANGKRVKGADGKFIANGEKEVTRNKTKQTRDFVAAIAADTDPDGPGVRVWRAEVK